MLETVCFIFRTLFKKKWKCRFNSNCEHLCGNHTKTGSMFVSRCVICQRGLLPAAWYLITCVIKCLLCSLLLPYLPHFWLWVCAAPIRRDYFLNTWHVCVCKYVGNIVCAQVHRLLIRCLQALNSKCLCQLRLRIPVQAWENTSFNVWMKLYSGCICTYRTVVGWRLNHTRNV